MLALNLARKAFLFTCFTKTPGVAFVAPIIWSPKMKRTRTTSSTQQSHSSRCTFTSASGGRCRMFASSGSPYCPHHAKSKLLVTSALATELIQAAGSLASPEEVNHVLAKIFLALADDRLTTRKASVLSYIGQMLLRSHREIAFHKKLAEEAAAREAEEEDAYAGSSWNIPRPIRDPVEPPQPAVADSAPPAQNASAPVSSPTASTPASANEPGSATASAQEPPLTSPQAEPSKPFPPFPDLNHFFPRDPTLRPGLQEPRNTYVPPDEEELRYRELKRQYASHRRRRW